MHTLGVDGYPDKPPNFFERATAFLRMLTGDLAQGRVRELQVSYERVIGGVHKFVNFDDAD